MNLPRNVGDVLAEHVTLEVECVDRAYLNLYIQVSLLFDRHVRTRGNHPTPGRFRTRVVTDGVTPSVHADYKHSRVKQYFKLVHGVRTETTINDAGDFGVGRRLHNLPTLARIGFKANRRLLDAERTSCDTLAGADAYHKVCQPVIVDCQRVPALRFDHPVTQALLVALVVERTPHPFRYKVTGFGLRSALVLTRIHIRFLTTVMADAGPRQPDPSPLGRALDKVANEIDRLADSLQIAA